MLGARVPHSSGAGRGARVSLAAFSGAVLSIAVISGCTSEASPTEPADEAGVSLPPLVGAEFTGTLTEWTEAMVACLNSAGWSASIPEGTPPGGFDVDDPGIAQEEVYRADLESCMFEEVGEWVEIRSESDLRNRFDALVVQAECLIEAGYEITGPPSFQAYSDAFNTQGDTSSFLPLAQLRGDDAVAGQQLCPFELRQ